MADVRPFKAVRYNSQVVADLNTVISPPYDVINDKLQDELYLRSPYGIVRIDFSKDSGADKYEIAGKTYAKWLAGGVLARDAEPSIYYVEEDYLGEFKEKKTRSGFLAAVRVETAESGVYRPHEKTLEGPKADRLNLTRATKANLSPVFSLYDDPQGVVDKALAQWKATAGAPLAEVKSHDGATDRIWAVTDAKVIEIARNVMKDKSFFIADGHHRYETALNYRKEMLAANPAANGEEPWNFVLMYLVNLWSEGLSVLPTHRAVFNLKDFSAKGFVQTLSQNFVVEEVAGFTAMTQKMVAGRGSKNIFGMALKGEGKLYIFEPRSDLDLDALLSQKTKPLRSLDVTVLHSLVIESCLGISEADQANQTNLFYVKDSAELLKVVEEGKADIGFFMNPTPVQKVKESAEEGERMPQKSTYFYPKIVTGLLINPLD